MQPLKIIVLFFGITLLPISSPCIPNTPCRCIFNRSSFILQTCSNILPDLPLLNLNQSMRINELFARKSLLRWPPNICHYSRLEQVDLSDSIFDVDEIDLSCLLRVKYLNLSRTTLKRIPTIQKNSLTNLQILDLSHNQIEFVESTRFRSLNQLRFLSLEKNPLKELDSFNDLFRLSSLQVIDLTSTRMITEIHKPLSFKQWRNMAEHWKRSNRSLTIRTNSIPFQSILPGSEQFSLMSNDSLWTIFSTLSNSSLISLVSTPRCDCTDLRNYQRVLPLVKDQQNWSRLMQTSMCLIPNGIIHARVFDYRTLKDLNCSIFGKMLTPLNEQNHSQTLMTSSMFFIFVLFLKSFVQ